MGSTKVKKIVEEVAAEPKVIESHSEEPHDVESEPEIAALDARNDEEKKAESKSTEAKTAKKAATKKPKKGAARVRSKKYQAVAETVEKSKLYDITEAIELAKKSSYAKFGGSLEAHMNTTIKNLRGLVTLPHLSGKAIKVLAFGPNAIEAGADMAGDDAKVADIEKGKIDFDVIVATPVWMPKLARSAKILGPRGLMPNPKNGTVTDNLEKAIAELKSGKVEYRTESNLTTMHLMVGSLNQPDEELVANIKTLFGAIGKSKLKNMVLSPTMGPALKVNLNTL